MGLEKRMKQGSLGERVLARSVLKHIHREKKALREPAAIGQDFSDISDIVCADGMFACPEIAYMKADNNFACSGARPEFARFLCMLPEHVEEPYIKQYMGKLIELAAVDHVQIAGGQSVVDFSIKEPRFYVTMCGHACVLNGYHTNIKRIMPGFEIVMTKEIGLLGTEILIQKKGRELAERFPKIYIEEAKRNIDTFRVRNEAQIAAEHAEHVCYMHDISSGGVYRALWQLSVRIKKGIHIEHKAIPVRQETIEFCEYFNLNPYMLEGTGSLLIVCEDGKAMCKELSDCGIRAAVIGRVTENQDKIIAVGDDVRYLNYPEGDELFKVFA